MKIIELTGYKSDPLYKLLQSSSDIPDFIDNIKNSGYSEYYVGKGMYAGVFAKPGDPFVIKIFKDDPGYEKFLSYALQHQSNPHVPRIKGRPITFQKIYKIVRLERLREMTKDTDWKIYEKIRDYTEEQYDKSEEEMALNKQNLQKLYPQLVPLLDEILYNGYDYQVDMTEGNVMFRGSVPVITDPYTAWDM
jgi:hypothetical protein